MYQIYLLSVVTLLLSGITLAFERLRETVDAESILNEEAIKRPTYRMILGVVTLLVGFFQFLTVAPEDVPVVGDLVPAVTGILLGGILLVEYYRGRSSVESPFIDTINRVFVENGSNFGLVGIFIALLHFLFHRVLFL